MEFELAIIGAGPAGYSASIYAGRSGIKTITFDMMAGGGLASSTPRIENYAGFMSISGFELMENMQKQAGKYAQLQLLEEVQSIQKNNNMFTLVTSAQHYTCKAIILATGTRYRTLDIPGETTFLGKGVSYCATCDGPFFKGKNVAVIGGGNTALIEAIFLKQVGCKNVTVIHRRDRVRAEHSYVQEAIDKGVNITYNTHVVQILGTQTVEALELHNTLTDVKQIEPYDGVFVAIGEQPNNALAKQMKIKLDDKGFIIVDKQQRTTVKALYAAGDITGGLRQIITAAAQGAVAALTSTEVLGKQYPY